MTKAKMPVAKHRTWWAQIARDQHVLTEELTFAKDDTACVDPSGIDPYAPSGRRPKRGAL